jgi:hypothetical protein
MVDKFHAFAKAVRTRFEDMSKEPLFVVNSDRDLIWDKYLSAFPLGTNPVFRERTEHDCTCCRHFIRDIGSVVAIQNGALASVWDLNGIPEPYQTVADAMSEYVKGLPIRDVFLVTQSKHGTESSVELKDGVTRRWNHFAVEAPKKFIVKKADLDTKRGEIRTTVQVLSRGVAELEPEAVATVADLIEQNALYRGQEYKRSVLEFQQLQARVRALDPKVADLTLWTMADHPVARFRNTVIGTLVQDLSSGADLEAAVRMFETKVAPQNYKRPTALITKGMIDRATKEIEELGLEQALERRHARLSDVSVNSVLFVDNAVQGEMKGGIKGLLMKEVKPAPFDPKKAEEISIDAFVARVLPNITGLKLYLENGALGNFVSMTAPVHADSKSLFRWNNDFAWSYDGNVTDSIKDKVKRAGGQVENVAMRVSLAWNNFDDLDLHVVEPDGNHIYYMNKSQKLDVDMNAGGGQTREPVENVRWVKTPPDGIYQVFVHNFCKRESIDVGFTVEIESPNGLDQFRLEKALASRAEQKVATITVKRGQVEIKPASGVTAGSISQEKWGLKTLDLVRVNSVVLSPNYWDGNAVGNKHWFFILEGCKNPLPTRGIYNEFLSSKLEKHRKVFEVLGDKTKCSVAEHQLSGIGFSSTRKDRVTVVATGPSLNKTYTVVFGKE